MIRGSYYNGFAPRDGMPLYPSLWQGGVGAWAPCLGPSGVTLRDWSGFGRHATCTNMTMSSAWSVTNGQYSLLLDGTNDYVSIPAMLYGTAFAISVWVQPNAVTGAQMILAKKTTSTSDANQSVQLFLNGSDIIFRVFSGVDNFIGRTAASVATTSMQHIACTYSGGTTSSSVQIFRNGIRVDSADSTGGTFSTFNDGNIITSVGAQNVLDVPANFFAGRIDDLRIMRGLSQNEIQSLASRRGIAYDLAPLRMPYSEQAAFRAAWALRQRLILGGGGGLG